jgi:hypothetical protein
LGGTISGMTKIGLVLANGTDRISPPASATTFVFPTYIARKAAYAVSVTAQPAGQQCTVPNGTGMGDDKISKHSVWMPFYEGALTSGGHHG